MFIMHIQIYARGVSMCTSTAITTVYKLQMFFIFCIREIVLNNRVS